MDNLSDRQRELLIAIFRSMKIYGKAPSYSEMVQNLDVSSKQAIADLLLHLNDKGVITISENKHRGIYLSASGIKALVDYGVIKESEPFVSNGQILYNYNDALSNSSFPKVNEIFVTIDKGLILNQIHSANSSIVGEDLKKWQETVSFTSLNRPQFTSSEDKNPHGSYMNFQHNLFVLNPELKKYFSGNTIDFKPDIKLEGIFSFFKKLFGI